MKDARFWTRRLDRGEELLWAGRPRWTFQRDMTALKLALPAAGACLGLLVMRESLYVQLVTGLSGADAVALDAGTVGWIKVAAGAGLAYLAGYLWVFCVTSPWTVRYALTSRRALIRRRLPWPSTHATRLTPGLDIVWDGEDPGTILFDEVERSYGRAKKARTETVETHRLGFVRIDRPGPVDAAMRQIASGQVAEAQPRPAGARVLRKARG